MAVLFSGLVQAQSNQSQGNQTRKAEAVSSKDSSTDTIYLKDHDGKSLSPDAVTPDSPAPGLTQLFIYNVCSDAAGCETIANNQYQTQLTHGGSNIDVYVWEIGFGYGEVTKQGSVPLSNLPGC